MSALHLLWITPVVFMAGYITCGLLCANGPDEKRKPVANHIDGERETNGNSL